MRHRPRIITEMDRQHGIVEKPKRGEDQTPRRVFAPRRMSDERRAEAHTEPHQGENRIGQVDKGERKRSGEEQ